jgi:hypothetical protein
MSKKWKRTCLLAAAIIWVGTAVPAFADKSAKSDMQPGSIPIDGQQSRLEYPDIAQIDIQEAAQLASDETGGGKVLKLSLGKRDGFLVYKVKTASPYNSIMEVTVDAGTGTALVLTEQSPDEMRNEGRAHHDGSHQSVKNVQHSHHGDNREWVPVA